MLMMAGFVDLQVTNIDPGIPQSRLRQLVQELFAECGGVSLHSLSTYRWPTAGNCRDNVLYWTTACCQVPSLNFSLDYT